MGDPRTDEELLAAVRREPEAFGVFYRRHVSGLLGYFLRRTRQAELAADLTAETFAAALDGLRRFDARRGPAVAWLYGIARRQLGTALRRGAVEDRARRRLRMAPLDLTDKALERIQAEADVAMTALDRLPADQREAIKARVIDERAYADIATTTRTSEAVVRKRVSRGLAGLRSRMGGDQP
jgi:RNA polymerase sigma factor (sigma-70 family)